MSNDRDRPGREGLRRGGVPSNWERIDPFDRFDIAYWCRALACSQAELEEAVRSAGPLVTAVRAWLARRR